MTFIATPLTAALAGTFSALVWPLLWPFLEDSGPSGSVGLVLGTLFFIALPAHAFVVGFRRTGTPAEGTLDTALLKRIGAWLFAAAATAAVMALYRAWSVAGVH